MDLLNRLMKWYEHECNGDWEHSYGVCIDTLDNPGWSLFVDLKETYLEGEVFNEVHVERSDGDWLICKIDEGQFKAAGGCKNLSEMIKVFIDWADSCR